MTIVWVTVIIGSAALGGLVGWAIGYGSDRDPWRPTFGRDTARHARPDPPAPDENATSLWRPTPWPRTPSRPGAPVPPAGPSAVNAGLTATDPRAPWRG